MKGAFMEKDDSILMNLSVREKISYCEVYDTQIIIMLFCMNLFSRKWHRQYNLAVVLLLW